MSKIELLGFNIGYSRSPSVHAAIARAIGANIDFRIDDIAYDRLQGEVYRLLAESDGFFVTKPYKTDVAKMLGSQLPSVNVVRSRDSMTFDTDGVGFVLALERAFPEVWRNVESALILGAGGAASSAAAVLSSRGVRTYILNRTLIRAARLVERTNGAQLYANQSAQLIVNCTSVGQNGEDVLRELCVLPSSFDYAFDFIYSQHTSFLRRLGANGAKTADGRDMLIFQAIEGDKFLLGRDIDTMETYEKVKRILQKDGDI